MSANEIIIVNTNPLGKSRLGTVTNKINTLGNKTIANEKERAKLISKVITEELHIKAGFASVADWSERFIKMNKSTVSRINKVVTTFGDNEKIWNAFTMSQMFEMLNAPQTALDKIFPDMTVKEIRDIIKAEKEIIDENSGDETDANSGDENNNIIDVEAESIATTAEDFTVALSIIRKHMKDGTAFTVKPDGDGWKIEVL